MRLYYPRVQNPSFWLLITLICLWACPAQNSQNSAIAKAPSTQAVATKGQAQEVDLDYAEFITGNASREDRLPMIVAIHGLGDSPEGFSALLRDFDLPARVILPRGPEKWHNGYTWFPIRDAKWADGPWVKEVSRSAKRIAKLIAHLRTTRPTKGKPLVMGFSQGGILSFTLATHHPEDLGLAIPIGGFLPLSLVPANPGASGSTPPVLAMNGEADTVIPFHLALNTVKKLKPLGIKVNLRGYPGVAHRIPPTMHAALFVELRTYLESLGATKP